MHSIEDIIASAQSAVAASLRSAYEPAANIRPPK